MSKEIVGEKGVIKYAVAHNNNDVFHYVEIPEGYVVTTGQPNFDEVVSEQAAVNLIETKRRVPRIEVRR